MSHATTSPNGNRSTSIKLDVEGRVSFSQESLCREGIEITDVVEEIDLDNVPITIRNTVTEDLLFDYPKKERCNTAGTGFVCRSIFTDSTSDASASGGGSENSRRQEKSADHAIKVEKLPVHPNDMNDVDVYMTKYPWTRKRILVLQFSEETMISKIQSFFSRRHILSQAATDVLSYDHKAISLENEENTDQETNSHSETVQGDNDNITEIKTASIEHDESQILRWHEAVRRPRESKCIGIRLCAFATIFIVAGAAALTVRHQFAYNKSSDYTPESSKEFVGGTFNHDESLVDVPISDFDSNEDYTTADKTEGFKDDQELVTSVVSDLLRPIYDFDFLSAPASAQYRAFQWLIYEDSLQLTNSYNYLEQNSDIGNWIVQRFSLVAFYYSTTDDTEGGEGGEDVIGWGKGSRWLSGVHECQWQGVTCGTDFGYGTNHIKNAIWDSETKSPSKLNITTKLDLPHHDLKGTIPIDLLALKDLEILILNGNQFSGQIPGWLSEMKSLEALLLENNLFTGSIPKELSFLPNLHQARMAGNLISGEVPQELCKLNLDVLTTDSLGSNPKVKCPCCKNRLT